MSSTGRIQVHQTELLITRAAVSDSGKYVCNATNNKGIAVASAHLRVFRKYSWKSNFFSQSYSKRE